MELNVKIHSIGETQNVSATFSKREFIVETQETYPQYLLLQVVKDKCNVLNNFQVGQLVSVSINLKGRLWTDKEGVEKCFNTIECWKINVVGNEYKHDNPTNAPAQPFETISNVNVEDFTDLPF